ncbi:ABC transporter permease [Pseudonocardia lacus]|uniref:ABC transporter permease n=1 Tax=Pseudonocardia lacus TaxID=2835865 RepID=UPI00202884BF|nr:ABC transporter permease [Pseudonocardia lacus]
MRGLVGLVGFLALWELVSRTGLVRREFLPPPSEVGARLGELVASDAAFRADVLATLLAWLIAIGLATAIAVPVGLVLGQVEFLRRATQTLVEFLRPIPSVALIPLAVVLLGSGPSSKISLAVYASVWPILFNTVYALGEIEPQRIEAARSFGLKRMAVLRRVALPSAAPFVMTGIRLSAAIALIVVVTTELLTGGQGGGLGQFITIARSGGGAMDVVLAGALTAGIIGYVVNFGLERAQRQWLGWSEEVGR